jgi:ATPase subunit of ABC transporter with duplicated ATPase domains
VFFLTCIISNFAAHPICQQQDEKEKAMRAKKQAETQEFIARYLEDRKKWKEEEKKKRAEEMAVIEEWNRKMEQRFEALRAQKLKVYSDTASVCDQLSFHLLILSIWSPGCEWSGCIAG